MLGHSHMLFSAAAAIALNSLVDATTHFSLSGAPLALNNAGALNPLAPHPLSTTDLLFKMVFYSGIIIGALLPDIDHPQSSISRLILLPRPIVKKYFKHRTLTHSLFGILLAVVFWGLVISLAIFGLTKAGIELDPVNIRATYTFYAAVMIGCVLHSIEDTMTVAGVPWLYPFYQKSQRIPLVSFRTGGKVEYIVVLVALALVSFGLYAQVLIL
ncbi:metal-dependent hydrolase [Ktedonospora formicarum]|uniref:Metal-dependent hydrolase n=1 Tax=Ktedonospora formicarum TaxID=2778364 RepID=A0A8J3I819_9CHLR|nr:metal-dependent hydrolase [Ktedonospora formicarum]GHO46404.1 hypothetical protein KSX_45670 [Ktedonospora formicarum]